MTKALDEVRQRGRARRRVFVVLIGHGNSTAASAKFNLPGPDMGAGGFRRCCASCRPSRSSS